MHGGNTKSEEGRLLSLSLLSPRNKRWKKFCKKPQKRAAAAAVSVSLSVGRGRRPWSSFTESLPSSSSFASSSVADEARLLLIRPIRLCLRLGGRNDSHVQQRE